MCACAGVGVSGEVGGVVRGRWSGTLERWPRERMDATDLAMDGFSATKTAFMVASIKGFKDLELICTECLID